MDYYRAGRISTPTTATNRGSAWSDDEVKALLAVWGESNIQEELNGAVRKKKQYFLTFQEK